MSKVLAIISARLNSQRLPNKVLLQIPPNSGVSMLELVVRKAMLAKMVNKVCVVTPDKELIKLLDFLKVEYCIKQWEGRDVLREYYEAATLQNLHYETPGIIVRLTGDCPLLQPEIIDRCVEIFLESDVDYVYNSDGKYNDGTDVEVFSFEALKQAYCKAKEEEREHVGLWLRRNLKKKFCSDKPPYEVESVNTKEDYRKICKIINNSHPV